MSATLDALLALGCTVFLTGGEPMSPADYAERA